MSDEEQKETALACATVSFNNAVKTINNAKFLAELLELVSKYPHAEELNKQALS